MFVNIKANTIVNVDITHVDTKHKIIDLERKIYNTFFDGII